MELPEKLPDSGFLNIFTYFCLMDSFWIYIIIAIVYAITRVFKKATEPGDVGAPPPDREVRHDESGPAPSQRPRQLTFEELLREITEAKQPTPPKPAPRPVPAPEPYASYDAADKDEDESLEEVNYNYNKKNRKVPEQRETERVSLEELYLKKSAEGSHSVLETGKFEQFEEKKEPGLLENYLGDIKDAEGWKKAVVMNEILTPRFRYW